MTSYLSVSPSACLLVSHGSRDPRPEIAVSHLAKLLRQRVIGLVDTAVLELSPQPLHQQILAFGDRAATQGYMRLQILPLFLLPGAHVKEDVPTEVAIASQKLATVHPDLAIELRPHLGSHPHLKDFLIDPVDAIATQPQTGRIVMSHGSRHPQGNDPVESIAQALNARAAYWSVPPTLATQITELVKIGHPQIVVLPYFLFGGGIWDAIVQEVQQLAQQFPYVQFQVGRPFQPTAAIADLVVDLLHPSTKLAVNRS